MNHPLSRVNQGLLLLLIVSSLLSRIKIPFLEIGVHFILIGLTGLFAIVYNSKYLIKQVHCYPYLWTIFTVFYAWVWISAFSSEWRAIALRYACKYSIYAIIFLALVALLGSNVRVKTVDKIILSILTLIAMGGYLEQVFPGNWLITLFSYPDYYPRISSILQSPNAFGILMAISSIITLLWNRDRSYLPRQYWAYPFLALTAFSASRNGWLVLLIGLALLTLYRQISLKLGINIICFWLLCLLVVQPSSERIIPQFWSGNIDSFSLKGEPAIARLIAHPKPDRAIPIIPHESISKSSMQDRVILWKKAIKTAKIYPISGVGVGVFQEVFSRRLYGHSRFNTHNLFLSLLVELGIVGLLLFLGCLALVVRIAIADNIINFIPFSLFLFAQIFDYFIYEYAITTIAIYFLARGLISTRRAFVLTSNS